MAQEESKPEIQQEQKPQDQAESLRWPLEADRLSVNSPLLTSLVQLAGYYGRRSSIASLTATLPIPKTGITPSLFIRAAERIDLDASMGDRSLEALAKIRNFPCILVLSNNQSCIVWKVVAPKDANEKK